MDQTLIAGFELANDIARRVPAAEFVYEAIVDIGERSSLGSTPQGDRFIVPIVGGEFRGPRLSGLVLHGGADRQLLRPDGVRELDASYELQTEDEVVLTVRNQLLIDEQASGSRHCVSHLRITAPKGRYDWLNRCLFTGTLDVLRPHRDAVLIRVYRLSA